MAPTPFHHSREEIGSRRRNDWPQIVFNNCPETELLVEVPISCKAVPVVLESRPTTRYYKLYMWQFIEIYYCDSEIYY